MSKRWWWWLGAAIIVLLVGVGLRHDAGLYSAPVAQVTSVQNGQAQKEVDHITILIIRLSKQLPPAC